MAIEKIVLSEHKDKEVPSEGELYEHLAKRLSADGYNPKDANHLLGLDWANRSRTSVQASYFIGLKWIEEGKSFVQVNPKVENLDFVQMFIACFNSRNAKLLRHLKKIYQIDFNAQAIKTEVSDTILTPLLITHFLKLVESLLHRKIKFDYELKEEVLNKVKGRMLLTETIRRLHSVGRLDLNKCAYQDYTINTLENQIIKKALLFVSKYLNVNAEVSCSEDLKRITHSCLARLHSVDANVPLSKLRRFKVNPLFRDYKEVLELALYILKRYSYSLEEVNAETEKSMPPYWIDMSLLFELYVYQKLQEAYGKEIDYHVSSYGNEVDFVKYDERLIIDTKYSLYWKNKIQHEHIRQLSGYARNISLRGKVMKEAYNGTSILDCLFIYPDEMGMKTFFLEQDLLSYAINLDAYLRFYKMPISLPLKESY